MQQQQQQIYCNFLKWAYIVVTFILIYFFSIFQSIDAVKLKHEYENNPVFNFSLDHPRECKQTPDPSRVSGASYFVIECQPSIDEVKITFNGTHNVFNSDMTQIKSFVAYPTEGKLLTYFVQICNDLTNLKSCLTYQIDIRRLSKAIPKLSYGGLVFSQYPDSLPPPIFNPNNFVYNISLYANEPVVVSAVADPEFFVNFYNYPNIDASNFTEDFTDGSRSIVYTPEGLPGSTNILHIYVANSEQTVVSDYTINIYLEEAYDPNLATLDVYPGRLDPQFTPHQYAYYYRVPDGTQRITLTLTPMNKNNTLCSIEDNAHILEDINSKLLYAEAKMNDNNNKKQHDIAVNNSTGYVELNDKGKPYQKHDIFLNSLFYNKNHYDHSLTKSSNIVVQCFIKDKPSYIVRYILAVVQQSGGTTQLSDLQTLNGKLNRKFDPLDSGPYIVTLNSSTSNDPTSKWIQFTVKPMNPNARVEVEGIPVNSSTHLSKFFRVELGETRPFRITVHTETNSVAEEYFMLVDRSVPWYKKASTLSYWGTCVGWVTSISSTTRLSYFLNNARFLQSLSVIDRLHGLPESVKNFLTPMHIFNLQGLNRKYVYFINTTELKANKTTPIYSNTLFAQYSDALKIKSFYDHDNPTENITTKVNNNISPFLQQQLRRRFNQAHPMSLPTDVAAAIGIDTKNIEAELESIINDALDHFELYESESNNLTLTIPATTAAGDKTTLQRVDAFTESIPRNVKTLDTSATPVQSFSSSWKPAYKDKALLYTAMKEVLHAIWNEKKQQALLSGQLDEFYNLGPRRVLLEITNSSYRNAHEKILLQLDAKYAQQQKLLSFCASIILTSSILLILACTYIVIWMLYLRDSYNTTLVHDNYDKNKQSIFKLRQDFPAVLRPETFWTFVCDYALISYLQSSLGILCMPSNVNTLPMRIYGITATAKGLAWLALIGLLAFPLAFLILGCVILTLVYENIVFSSVFQRYHDEHIEQLKAYQTYLNWIPIVPNLLKVEITSISPISRICNKQTDINECDREHTDDGPLEFSEEIHYSSAPLCVGNVQQLVEERNEERLIDIEKTGSNDEAKKGYRALLPPSNSLLAHSTAIKISSKKQEFKVKLNPESYAKHTETLNTTVYNRYPKALVGYKNYKIKNPYDLMLNIRVNIQLRHLPCLMNLRSYSLWVPYEHLQQTTTDAWGGFFADAPKGNTFFWALDRLIMLIVLLFLSAVNDLRGVLSSSVFGLLCFATAILYLPSLMNTATSKWFRLMLAEEERLKHEEEDRIEEFMDQAVWPYHQPKVQAAFAEIYERKREVESWGSYGVYLNHLKKPFKAIASYFFWNTRLWITIKEVIQSSVGVELAKALLLLTVLLGNANLQACGDTASSFFSIVIVLLAVIGLNWQCISDWKEQFNATLHEFYCFLCRILIELVEWGRTPRIVSNRFTHFLSSLQRVLQGEKGVCFGYPRFLGERVRYLKIKEVCIVNNELGLHLKGTISPTHKTSRGMKYMNFMERERSGLYKMLHVYGAVNAWRPELYRELPVQMPFKQFFQSGKGNENANVMQRLACTIQIVNYNESRTVSGYTHSSEDDSFLSLYTDPKLMPQYGKIKATCKGHGYVVRWIPDKGTILIRGPGIKGDQEYSVTSSVEDTIHLDNHILESTDTELNKQQSKDLKSEATSNRSELCESFPATSNAAAICRSSGILVVTVKPNTAPDLNKVIRISHEQTRGDVIEVDPRQIKVEFLKYEVGTSTRQEMVIRSRELTASAHPYSVEWSVRRSGKTIAAVARSPADGALFVPWQRSEAPDLWNYISLHNITEGSPLKGSVINIDPQDTDAHQFVLPPVQNNLANRVLTGAYSYVTAFTALICGTPTIDDEAYLGVDPIPCTLVQCVNPLEKKFRIEPNFLEAMKTTKARIEELVALKTDLDDPLRLGHLWMHFMSTTDFITFWGNFGVPIVIRGIWINPLINLEYDYIRQYMQSIHDATPQFRNEIERRIDFRIERLVKQFVAYSTWNKAYNDNDMYAALLYRDRIEWTVGHSASSFEGRSADLQNYKNEYQTMLPNFQYPMTVDATAISQRDKLRAQLHLWSEELYAWLIQCEAIVNEHRKNEEKSYAEMIVSNIIRAVECSVRSNEQVYTGTYRTALHYVLSSCVVRGFYRNWHPDPLAAHYCMIRLFRGNNDDPSRVDWDSALWTPCFLKLEGNRIIILFPHENDATADIPNYTEADIMKRYSWNQLHGYYFPLECFQRMLLSIDASVAHDPTLPEEVKHMHAKLVLHKATEYYVDDAYVKSIFDNEFVDEVLYGQEDTKTILKIRLCNTVPNIEQHLYNPTDRFDYADRCSVLPLTFRFDYSFFNKWQSAIRFAEMNNPRKLPVDFDGRLPYNVIETNMTDKIAVEYQALSVPCPPISSASSTTTTESSEESLSADSSDSPFRRSNNSKQELQLTPKEEPLNVDTVESKVEQFASDIATYEGLLQDFRYSGKNAKLYNNEGRLVYKGDWLEGQRWGDGCCFFYDACKLEWKFQGVFVADEMRKGQLKLMDEKELNRLVNSKDVVDHQTIVEFNGTFNLSDQARGPGRAYIRSNTHSATRGSPKIHPMLLKSLFNTADPAGFITNEALVIDIRRAISACADELTWNSTTAWTLDNYGGNNIERFGREKLPSSTQYHHNDSGLKEDETSSFINDAKAAIDEYLPYRSKWARMLDPRAGYQTVLDRMVYGDLVFANGSKYRGEIKEGKPDGRGIFKCLTCNLTYNGYWREGHPHGYGVMKIGKIETEDYLQYYGNFLFGVREGKGVLIADNGNVIIRGTFVHDVLHGSTCNIELSDVGVKNYPKTYKRYIGKIEDGVFSGKGKLEWSDGVSYIGELSEGLRHGEGSMYDADNNVLVSGQWEKDYPNGKIAGLLLPDGSIFTGSVRDGQRQGIGELFYKGAPRYEGFWISDVPNGQGALYSSDGVYEGGFKGGKRHGVGKFEFYEKPLSNGRHRFYEGNWKDDLPDGSGRYLNELGSDNVYRFREGALLPASVKPYKAGPCGKLPVLGTRFAVESNPILSHDPKYWGLKRELNLNCIKKLHNLGQQMWLSHLNKPFEYKESTQPTESFFGDLNCEDPIPRPPIKLYKNMSLDFTPLYIDYLEIFIINAEKLLSPPERLLQPYCKVRLGRLTKRTKIAKDGGSNPKWNSSLMFSLKASNWVNFEVWDNDLINSDAFVGAGEYNLSDFLSCDTASFQLDIPLTKKKNDEIVEVGNIFVTFKLIHGLNMKSNDCVTTEMSQLNSAPIIPNIESSLEVHVIGYKNLYTTEIDKNMDPYFNFIIGESSESSECIRGGGNTGAANIRQTLPYFNEPNLQLEVWDKGNFDHNIFVGYANIALDSFNKGSVTIFRYDKKSNKEIPAGEVELAVLIDTPEPQNKILP